MPPSSADDGGGGGGLGRSLSALTRNAGKIVLEAGRHAALPVAFVALLLVFLLVQDRADRRDPKLALAPMSRDRSLQIPSGGGRIRA